MASRNDGCFLRLMEFKNFFFQAWKFIKNLLSVLKSHGKVKFCLKDEFKFKFNNSFYQCTK